MNFKQLIDDEKAVSPVIGVILMVAITVILAAVIGTFVLGLGDQVQNTTPQASFGFELGDDDDDANGVDSITITHESGDSIDAADLMIKFSSSSDDNTEWGSSGTSVSSGSTFLAADEDYTGSASADVTLSSGEELAGQTVRVVYDSPDSDSSSTLAKKEVPSA